MAIIENWLPPSRENWELICTAFKYGPLLTTLQWLQPWYGMGKTSTSIPGNIPGKVAWLTMEAPGFLTLMYIMYSLPNALSLSPAHTISNPASAYPSTSPISSFIASLPLPPENYLLASLFVIHYIYRAVLCPILAPSMSPIHILVWLFALIFQLCNSISIGGYLAGYGPVTKLDWAEKEGGYQVAGRIAFGLMLWGVGFVGSAWHDEELREIRRAVGRAQERQKKEGKGKGENVVSVDKFYVVPKNGFFNFILYPHYFFEWIEWIGFWIMGGIRFTPGRTFVLNEVSTMLPRAIRGKQWYVDRFGKEKVGARKAIIPGLI